MDRVHTDMTSLRLSGVDLELLDRGAGRPILFLHPWIGLDPDLPFLNLLAQHGRLLAPSHPGFGRSTLPRHFSTVDDLAYFYLDLLEQLELRDCLLVGVSFGAWVAAEMAIKCGDRIGALVLADPVGVKLGGRETADIADHFNMGSAEFATLAYHDPERGVVDVSAMTDDQIEIVARNRDAAALYGWMPYMYDPKLSHRLYRIKGPVLMIKGEQDQVISPDYAARFAELLPDCRLEVIPEAGHFPHIEQPERLAASIGRFSAAVASAR